MFIFKLVMSTLEDTLEGIKVMRLVLKPQIKKILIKKFKKWCTCKYRVFIYKMKEILDYIYHMTYIRRVEQKSVLYQPSKYNY